VRSAPTDCTDERTGTADFVKDTVAMVGGTIIKVIAFRLNDGTRVRASFIIDNFSV
jgi:hypothetical protein